MMEGTIPQPGGGEIEKPKQDDKNKNWLMVILSAAAVAAGTYVVFKDSSLDKKAIQAASQLCVDELEGLDSTKYVKLNVAVHFEEGTIKVPSFTINGTEYANDNHCFANDDDGIAISRYVKKATNPDSIYQFSLIAYSPAKLNNKYSFAMSIDDVHGKQLVKYPADKDEVVRKLKLVNANDTLTDILTVKSHAEKTNAMPVAAAGH